MQMSSRAKGQKAKLRQSYWGPSVLLWEAPQTCAFPSCREGSRLGIVGGLGTVRPAGSVPVPPGSQAPEPAPRAGLLTRHIPSALGTQPHLWSRNLACGVADGGVIPHIQLSCASHHQGYSPEHWGGVGLQQVEDHQGLRWGGPQQVNSTSGIHVQEPPQPASLGHQTLAALLQ